MVDLNRYITPSQAAVILGCTPGRARQLTHESRADCLPGVIRVGNQALIPRRAVEKLAAKPRKAGRPRKFSPAKTSGKQAISRNPAK